MKFSKVESGGVNHIGFDNFEGLGEEGGDGAREHPFEVIEGVGKILAFTHVC